MLVYLQYEYLPLMLVYLQSEYLPLHGEELPVIAQQFILNVSPPLRQAVLSFVLAVIQLSPPVSP